MGEHCADVESCIYGASARARQHFVSRADCDNKHPRSDASTSDAWRTGSLLPTELVFKAKSHHVNHIATLLAAYAPTVWPDTHTRDQKFNKDKMEKKHFDANMKGLAR